MGASFRLPSLRLESWQEVVGESQVCERARGVEAGVLLPLGCSG